MNGSRKPRLPNEIMNLQFLYPDVLSASVDLDVTRRFGRIHEK